MEKVNGLHQMYKKLGETPNQTILRWKEEHPEDADKTMTYAGRLDPMAEGLLLILSGEELQVKEKYLHLPKTYEAEILWGFETDTLDILGLVTDSQKLFLEKGSGRPTGPSSRNFSPEKYPCPSREIVSGSLTAGSFEQEYPAYSSKPVNGKPLFKWAREGRLSQIEIPKHEVEIYSVKYLEQRTISKDELLRVIVERISLVEGDFRQKEILGKWQEVLNKYKIDEFVIDKIELKVSSGFYVRQFVSDLAKKLGTIGLTFHIIRTKVGDFDVGEAVQ